MLINVTHGLSWRSMAINMTFPSHLKKTANTFGKATLQPCKLDATHGSLSSWVLMDIHGSSWLIMARSHQGYSWLLALHGSSWLVLIIGVHGSAWFILAHHVSYCSPSMAHHDSLWSHMSTHVLAVQQGSALMLLNYVCASSCGNYAACCSQLCMRARPSAVVPQF